MGRDAEACGRRGDPRAQTESVGQDSRAGNGRRNTGRRPGMARPCMDWAAASALYRACVERACSCHRHLLGPRRWAAMRCTHRHRSTLWCVSALALWPSVRHGVQLREAVHCWDIRASLLVPMAWSPMRKFKLWLHKTIWTLTLYNAAHDARVHGCDAVRARD
jgi:hypothetical protein